VGVRHPIEGEADMPGSWKEITIEYNGKIINGDYKIAGKTVTVKTVRGMKEAPLSGLTPLYLAKMLLRELAREGRA
jgi:hypothetical protein